MKDSLDTVSIVIPCYNVAEYLEDCLKTVLAQEAEIDAIIFVDNNSTDDSALILQSIKDRHQKIILADAKTQGAPNARNEGLLHVHSNWVQFLDADDLLQPSKLAKQIVHGRKSNADVVLGSIEKRAVNGESSTPKLNNDTFLGLMSTSLGMTSSMLFRTEKINEVGGWNTDMKSSQEYELLFRIIKSDGRLELIDQRDTIIRERPSGQISKSNVSRNAKQYLQLRSEMFDHFKKCEPSWFGQNRRQAERLLLAAYDHFRKSDPENTIDEFNSFYKHFGSKFTIPNRMKTLLYRFR